MVNPPAGAWFDEATLELVSNAAPPLPLRPGLRVLEIGCGPGVAAREIVRRWPTVYVLGIDRSAKAIQLARAGARVELAQGKLDFRQVAAEAPSQRLGKVTPLLWQPSPKRRESWRT